MDMKLTLLLAALQCLHPLVSFCSACNLPTEDNPVSACAYCSDKHAGVRWMKHESSRYYDEIYIAFQCRDPENGTVFNRDDCFDGERLPFLSTVNPNEWRWYILEQELNEGTECNFTVFLYNSFYRDTKTLNTSSCTVKVCSEDSSTDCLISPIPTECPGGVAGDSVCSCSCRDGFSESRSSLTNTLLCRNINECDNKAHPEIECGGVIENCVDTEGGYSCLSNSTSTVSIQPTTTTPTPTLTPSVTIVSALSLEITPIQSVDDTGIHVSRSVITAPNTAPVIESDADIRVLIIIPLSVTVLIVLVLISLMFVIALNRCHNNDSVNKLITSWQNYDKFDPEFSPAVAINKKLSVNKSLESIIAPLQSISNAQGEHSIMLCTGQDAEREDTQSCNMNDINHAVLQPNEITDSGIIISNSGQSSSNYQDSNTSPVSAHTDDLVECSYSGSSFDVESENEAKQWMCSESQEHTRQAPVHPIQPSESGANAPSCSDNSQSWNSTDSGYVTKPGDTKCMTLHESDSQALTENCQTLVHPAEANTAFNSTAGLTSSSVTESIINSNLDFGTTEMYITSTCDHIYQHAQNVIDTSGISLELDEMNDDDMVLTLDGSTNDHLNNSIEQNISVNVRATQPQMINEDVGLDYIHEQQVPRYTINQAQNQTCGGGNAGVTNTVLLSTSDISGSSLSLMCDIEC